MKRKLILLILITALFSLTSGFSYSIQYIDAPPLKGVINVPIGNVKIGEYTRIPLITWGGDQATILGNGNARETAAKSIFSQEGLRLKLHREDDFKKQVESYMRGDTPYLRGTYGMINMASEVLSEDPRTRPIIVYQLTWSNGGDCLVVKPGIQTTKDLKGKTIAVQAYGPHVYYLSKILTDANLSINDVTIKWVRDLTGTDNTPMEAFYESDIDAAMMIIPDGLILTSNGTVGNESEGSVKGAKILLSTKTANRIISDVYAVRADYMESNSSEVTNFVHGLMMAEEELREIYKNKESQIGNFTKMIKASAEILLDSPEAVADAEALYTDCEYVGFSGNIKFFMDPNYPRNMDNLTAQIQSAFIKIGLISKKVSINKANLDFKNLQVGLKNTSGLEVPRFDPTQVAAVVQQKQRQDSLREGELFSFEVYFQPNQNNFSADMYSDDFIRVINLASTYGGAIITIEGHSDPLGYLKSKKSGETEIVLKNIIQSAKNLSLSRANSVKSSVIEFAKSKGIILDDTQFAVVGHGIMKPQNGMCGSDPCAPVTEQEWRNNMRVEFRIIQVEAESSVFKPL
ncbi:MAG: ABC transporter substrate-binding protein [Deltaproteobacteria bacterium]|nr:ABC transporter substrate-binding protein [Deltaproteobacteria bacterium]